MSEPITPESVPAPATDEVFDYGDRTIMQLRAQHFDVAEDFGTVISMPPAAEAIAPLTREIALPAAIEASDDPIARLEQKLDLALHQIALLQQRLESMDATLVRALMR